MYKTLFTILLLFTFLLNSFAQSSNCIVSIDNIFALKGAGRDKSERILGKCYSYNGLNKDFGLHFINEYEVNGILKSSFVFVADSSVSIQTNCYETYMKYKKNMYSYGFTLYKEEGNISTYIKDSYHLIQIGDFKLDDGTVIFDIRFLR